MTRAIVRGGDDLLDAAARLGLTVVASEADLAIVDADDDAALVAAVDLPSGLPRVFVAAGARIALLRAAGVAHVVARPATAATLGPAVFALERARERAPRALFFVSASGAVGRTSLVANLAVRLARRVAVVALDATGSGALAWRLGVTVSGWADLAAVGDELSEAHLRLAAAERDGALVVGGVGEPDAGVLARAVRVARAVGVVLVDGPDRKDLSALASLAERVYVIANPDSLSATLAASVFADLLSNGAPLVVSQARDRDVPALVKLFGRAPSFLLPADVRASRDALARRAPARGGLGNAYDAFAEIVLADVTE